jgi:hypothetical protein
MENLIKKIGLEYFNPIININHKNKQILLRDNYLLTNIVANYWRKKGYEVIED